MKIKFDNKREYRFSGADKMIAGGKMAVPKMELDAGGLLGETK